MLKSAHFMFTMMMTALKIKKNGDLFRCMSCLDLIIHTLTLTNITCTYFLTFTA
jgi:hypothetical protein